MSHPGDDTDIHSEAFLHRLMQRQLRLSISCALAFLGALLLLPMLNYFAPELMARRVAGFTLSWLILGVLFFPLVWMIAWIFIKRSIHAGQEHAVIGGVLVMLIIFLFLRDLRATFIIFTSIPVSVIGTFALLYFNGYTLNTMTFGGLALGIGMIVDASIVVI